MSTTTAVPLDAETRATRTDHDALRLWLRLFTCSTLIERSIRARLRERFGITLARFDFLAQLARSPAGLRMQELSRRLMVTGGNVTGLARELAAEGLVERRTDAADRRVQVIAPHSAWPPLVRCHGEGTRAVGGGATRRARARRARGALCFACTAQAGSR